MGIVQNLSLLALGPVTAAARSASGEGPGAVADLLGGRFAEVAPLLTAALHAAADRTWKVLEIALLGESLLERARAAPNSNEVDALQNQVRVFLDSGLWTNNLGGVPFFRQDCARELHAARKAGVVNGGGLDLAELARQAAAWTDDSAARDAERQAVERLAGEFRQAGYARLGRLLDSLQPGQGPPLLVAAVRYFFEQAIAQQPQLGAGLPWAGADLDETQRRGLAAVSEVMDKHGRQLDDLLAGGRDGETPGALDLHAEQRQGLPAHQEVLALLEAQGLDRRELRPSDILAVPAEADRQRIRDLVNRARTPADDQQRQSPAFRNALGKLAALVGDLEAAYDDFEKAAHLVPDLHTQAEAHANAYQVALERHEWADALEALKRAAARDPERFAPFPIAKYDPEGILRADGFGVTFQCRHRNSESILIVKALRTDVLERPVSDVFRELQALESLGHPSILRLRDCDFADGDGQRPFLVREHFEAITLAEHVARHGPLSVEDLAAVARLVAEALQAAHSRGILHRGVQPSNILVRKEGSAWRVKVINFGLALRRNVLRRILDHPAARSRAILGATVNAVLETAAPEQLGRLEGAAAGPASDMYSFGRTCYAALLRTTEPDDQEKEQIPAPLRKLLGQCTSFTIGRRPASFAAVLEQLTAAPAAAAAPAPTPVVRPEPAAAPERPAAAASRAHADEAAACVQRGIAHRQRGESDPAIAEFSRALQLDPRNALAFQGRGNAHSTKGEYDQAIADYSEALALDPRLPLTYVNRGLAYVKKRDSARAIADYTKAIQLDASLALAYLNRGSAHARLGQYDQAIADFTQALKLDTRLLLAYVNRGLAHAKKGDYERAIIDYTRALEIDPKNAEAKARRTEASKLLGRQLPAQPAGQGQGRPQRRRPRPGEAPAAPAGPRPAQQPANPGAPPRRPPAEGRERPAPAVAQTTRPPAAAQRPAAPPKPPAAEQGGAAAPATTGETRVLEGHADAVRCVVFSPDGRRLLSGSEDKTIRLWDVKTSRKLTRYAGHTGGVTSVAFSPDGERILSGSTDHSVRLWSIETGEEIRRFGIGRLFSGGHTDAVVSVAFSPDGTQALSAGWDKTVRLWDVESGKELRVLQGHSWLIHSVTYSPDGKYAIYGSEDQTVRLWELATGQEVRRFSGHSSWVLSVAVSSDGRQVLSGSSDGTMRLWSVARGKELRRFGGQMGLVQSVAFSPDGRQALSGEYTLPGENTIMRLWDIESGLELARFSGHTKLIWSVAFSPDGRFAASASADQTVRLWRLPRGG